VDSRPLGNKPKRGKRPLLSDDPHYDHAWQLRHDEVRLAERAVRQNHERAAWVIPLALGGLLLGLLLLFARLPFVAANLFALGGATMAAVAWWQQRRAQVPQLALALSLAGLVVNGFVGWLALLLVAIGFIIFLTHFHS